VTARHHKSESNAVSDFVEAFLWSNKVATIVTKEDLTITLLALLNAKSIKAEKYRPQGKPKRTKTETLSNVLQLPDHYSHHTKEFEENAIFFHRLMYQISKKSMAEFISSKANITLFTYFAENNGLAETSNN